MKKQFTLVLFIMLFVSNAFVKATDYYLATDGSDSNSGTSLSSPFQTFAKSVSVLKAGDCLFIRGGDYNAVNGADAMLEELGTESSPILITSYNGEDVTIWGSEIVTGWVSVGDGIYKKTGWDFESQQVFVDEVPLQQTGPVADPIAGSASDGYYMIEFPTDPDVSNFNPYSPYNDDLDSLRILPQSRRFFSNGRFFYDQENKVLYVRLKDDADPSGKEVRASTVTSVLSLRNSAYVTVSNLKFRHSNISDGKAGGGIIDLGDHCLVENCDIQWGDQAGIELGYYKTGNKVINCILNNNGNSGITASATLDFIIKDCEANNNNYRLFNPFWHAGGIKCVTDAYGVIDNCEVGNNYGCGIWFDYCNEGYKSVIKNNYIHDNGPQNSGMFIEVSRNFDIYNNIIDGNSRVGVDIAASDNINFFNNEVKNTTGMLDVAYGDTEEAQAGLRITRFPPPGITLSNNNVFNNVFYNNSECIQDIYIMEERPASGSYNNIVDYNLYYNTSGEYGFHQGDTYDFSRWQDLGNDTHGLIGDPKYLGTGGDVTKGSTSPVIDAGSEFVSFLSVDYYGTNRPQGSALDIGAFEYQSGEPSNIFPFADAGSDKIVKEGQTVTLDASGSYDTDGSIASYSWIEDETVLSTDKVFTSTGFTYGIHNVKLIVTDNGGAKCSDYVSIAVTAIPKPIIGQWNFDEDSGDALDQTGHELTAVIHNNGISRVDAVINGKYHGKAMYFSGDPSNGFMRVDNTYKTSYYFTIEGKFSVAGWFKREDAGGTYTGIMEKMWRLTSSPNGGAGSVWEFCVWDNSYRTYKIQTSYSLDYDKWYHVAASFDGEEMKIYVNGELDNTKTISLPEDAYVVFKSNFLFGSRDGTTPYVGCIDDIGIYGKVLTDDDVRSLYNGGDIDDNQPPIADAGGNITVTDNDENGSETVSLDASASFDDLGIETYSWSEDGTQIATGVNPNVTFEVGTHSVTLTVTDAGGLTDSQTIIVEVKEGGAPYVTQTVPKNSSSSVAINTDVIITFSEAMDLSTVSVSTNIPNISKSWSSNGDVLTLIHDKLSNSTSYFVDINGKDLEGNTMEEYNFIFTTESTSTGVDLDKCLAISVYPNPASTGEVYIQAEGLLGIEEVQLYNSAGVMIMTQPLMSTLNRIDLEGLESGIYIVRVISQNSIQTVKLHVY